MIDQKTTAKAFKDLITDDSNAKAEIATKIFTVLAKGVKEENDLVYQLELLESLREVLGDNSNGWDYFKEHADLAHKQTCTLVRKLVKEKYFPEKVLGELEEGNQ